MFTLPITDVYESIERPITYGVVCDLIGHNLLPKPDRIEFQEIHENKALTPGTTASDPDTHAHVPGDNVLQIDQDVQYQFDNNHWLQDNRRYARPIFSDLGTGTIIQPIYESMVVELTLSFYTPHINKLREWERDVRTSSSRGLARLLHELDYSYVPHPETEDLLKSVHALREKQFGYGDDYNTYYAKHASNNAVEVSAGRAHQWAHAERQVRVQGYLSGGEFGVQIESIGDISYKGVLNWKIHYSRPSSLIYTIPLMVHQQTMPAKWLPVPRDVRDYKNVFIQSPMVRGFSSNEEHYEHFKNIRVPDFDNAELSAPPKNYHPIVTLLLSLDHADPHILFNLMDMKEATLSAGVIDLIEDSLYLNLHQPYKTVILISLHKGEHLLDQSYLRCDANLDVWSDKPLNPREVYRVSISVLTDLNAVEYKYVKMLEDYPEATTDIICAINGINHTSPFRNNDMPNHYLLDCDITNPFYLRTEMPIINHDGTRAETHFGMDLSKVQRCRGFKTSHIVTMRTVMTSWVDSKPDPARKNNCDALSTDRIR